MKFDIAIVIPVYNEAQIIQKTLTLFSNETNQKCLLVIIDNGSVDSTTQNIHLWQKNNPHQPLAILNEKRKGSVFARKKGLFYAKKFASVIISTDADCQPLEGFYRNILFFLNNSNADVLVGYERQEPYVRLLKQIYLPNLMNSIAWMEKIEKNLFGPFFFGGYFGIKAKMVTKDIFPISNIVLPKEPSVIWSKHCNYSGYSFMMSKKNIQTSSRRFWSDPEGFISLNHSKAIRSGLPSKKEMIHTMKLLKRKENLLISLRMRHFYYRILMLLLDAVFIEKKISNKTTVSMIINKTCNLLNEDSKIVRSLSRYSFSDAKRKLLDKYLKIMPIALAKYKGQFA